MKLFFWTENEHEVCNHWSVFAEDETQARAFIVDHIREYWKPAVDSNNPDDDPAWCKRVMDDEIQDFSDPTKWSLQIIEVTPGVVIL